MSRRKVAGTYFQEVGVPFGQIISDNSIKS